MVRGCPDREPNLQFLLIIHGLQSTCFREGVPGPRRRWLGEVPVFVDFGNLELPALYSHGHVLRWH